MKRRTPESLVLHAILDYLAAERVLAFRMQTGVAEIEGRRVVFGTPGMADILACPDRLCDDGDWRPSYLWIEVKAARGAQSEFQRSFQAQVEDHGHDYLIARSIDDVREYLGGRRD